jgi:hypothetical protein
VANHTRAMAAAEKVCMWIDESPCLEHRGKKCKRLMRSVRECRGETGLAPGGERRTIRWRLGRIRLELGL